MRPQPDKISLTPIRPSIYVVKSHFKPHKINVEIARSLLTPELSDRSTFDVGQSSQRLEKGENYVFDHWLKKEFLTECDSNIFCTILLPLNAPQVVAKYI